MSDRIAKAVIFLSLCLLGASASDLLAATVQKYTCHTNQACSGQVTGYITGTNPPQTCTCNLNNGTVSVCIYTGNPLDTCLASNPDPNNQCTGTVQGNPGINCYKNYGKCPAM